MKALYTYLFDWLPIYHLPLPLPPTNILELEISGGHPKFELSMI